MLITHHVSTEYMSQIYKRVWRFYRKKISKFIAQKTSNVLFTLKTWTILIKNVKFIILRLNIKN